VTIERTAKLQLAQWTPPTVSGAREDAITAAALTVIRRALIEGVHVTRAGLAEEAAVTLGVSPQAALAEVDAVAQRVGVSSLG
jgi:hypothetical protein